jgi:UDP-glucose 4-epimerase
MNIALINIAGHFGQWLTHALAPSCRIIGIDSRPLPGILPNVEYHRIDLRRGVLFEILAESQIDAVIHLGMVHNIHLPTHVVYQRNIIGTELLLKHIRRLNIPKLIFLSSGDVYGPSPHNAHFLDEDAPLCGSQNYPEIRTLVAMDRLLQTFLWRYPDINVKILRPAHIVGKHVSNAVTRYLRLPMIPTMMGFDPMFQLTHENDVIYLMKSFVESSVSVRGIFNMASIEPISLHKLIHLLDKKYVPLPYPAFKWGVRMACQLQLSHLSMPDLLHLCFHNVLDTHRAETVLHYQPQFGLNEIIRDLKS